MPSTLSQTEIDERVTVLRRFREALLRQRERFSKYLQMLEKEPAVAGAVDPEQVEIHVAMGHAIVREIASFEQIVEPLQMMYREHDPEGASDLPNLKAALDRTRDEIVRRASHGRELLKAQLTSLRSEIAGLRIMRQKSSLYGIPEPQTIDISA